jgi:hypothetical protein
MPNIDSTLTFPDIRFKQVKSIALLLSIVCFYFLDFALNVRCFPPFTSLQSCGFLMATERVGPASLLA